MAGRFVAKHYEFEVNFVAWLTEFEKQLLEEGALAELPMIIPLWLGLKAFSVYDRLIPEKAKADYLLLRRELLLRCSKLSPAQQMAESVRFEREFKLAKMRAAAEAAQLAASAGHALPATTGAAVAIEAVAIEAVAIEAATVKEMNIVLEVATVIDAVTVEAATATNVDATEMAIATVAVAATVTAAATLTAPAASTGCAIAAAEEAEIAVATAGAAVLSENATMGQPAIAEEACRDARSEASANVPADATEKVSGALSKSDEATTGEAVANAATALASMTAATTTVATAVLSRAAAVALRDSSSAAVVSAMVNTTAIKIAAAGEAASAGQARESPDAVHRAQAAMQHDAPALLIAAPVVNLHRAGMQRVLQPEASPMVVAMRRANITRRRCMMRHEQCEGIRNRATSSLRQPAVT